MFGALTAMIGPRPGMGGVTPRPGPDMQGGGFSPWGMGGLTQFRNPRRKMQWGGFGDLTQFAGGGTPMGMPVTQPVIANRGMSY